MTISPAYMSINQIQTAIENKEKVDPYFLCERVANVGKVVKNHGIDTECSLQDYVFAPNHVRQHLEEKFEFQERISALQPHFSFADRINDTALALLARVKLYKLSIESRFKVEIEKTGVWAALVDSTNFCELGVLQLDKYRPAMDVMATRLDVLAITEPALLNQYAQRSKSFLSSLSNLFRAVNFPIGQLRHLTGAELSGIASKLHPQAFSLVSDEQLLELDFAKLSGDQVEAAIIGDGLDETFNRRVQKISKRQLQLVFIKAANAAAKMPPELFQSCPLSQMAREDISRMFIGGDVKPRFQKVSPQEIMDAISKIDNSILVNLSIEQISALDLSRVGSEKMGYIFDCTADNKETRKKKVQAIPLEQITANAKYLNRDQLKMLSLEQIQVLDLSTLGSDKMGDVFDDILDKEETKRKKVQAIPLVQIKANARCLNKEQLRMLSLEQIQVLDLSTLGSVKMGDVFDAILDKEETKRSKVRSIPLAEVKANGRYLNKEQLKMLSKEQKSVVDLPSLKDDQLEAVLDDDLIRGMDVSRLKQLMKHVSGTNMNLIAPEKLSGLDFTQLSDLQLNALFPGFTVETMYPGFTYTQKGSVYEFVKQTSSSRQSTMETQKTLDEKFTNNRNICIRNLQHISPSQFAFLSSKLAPEIVALYSAV